MRLINDIKKWWYEEDYLWMLKDINVTYTPTPVFLVNWETMAVWKNPYSSRTIITKNDVVKIEDSQKDFVTAQCLVHKFKDVETAIDFVKRNSHQIVVYEFKLQKSNPDPNFLSDPYVQYAKRPGSILIYYDWLCRRCGQIVDYEKFKCGCTESPSPWEPML
jgi:hypothetical protein